MRPVAVAGASVVILAALALPAPMARTAATSQRHAAVPILMYHVIARPPATAPYPDLYVPTPEFAAQMTWLQLNGYRAVTLKRVYDHWRTGQPLPKRPIVLTFDDGYRSIYVNARPLLSRMSWAGVLNLKIGNMHEDGGLPPRWIRNLIGAGWELASHTISHPDLTSLSAAQLTEEVAGSRWRLQRQFRTPVQFFCYPAGRFDAAVVLSVQRAGYLGATSTRYGLARPGELYTMARVRVSGGDGVAGLRAKLQALGT